MPEVLSRDAVQVGGVRGRYFRENFAQGGIDLAHVTWLDHDAVEAASDASDALRA
jgi:hypothetical protein